MKRMDAEGRARRFGDLHRAERGFLMPNAWDAGSAKILAAAGFPALGTTSAGIAFSLGKHDYEVVDRDHAVQRDEMFGRMREIVEAVPIPVNGDLEAGYGASPEAVAETVRLAIGLDLAGGNVEDRDAVAGLFDEDHAVARIAAAAETISASGRAFVLNARTDALLLDRSEALAIAIRRANRYLEAGASCVFTPGARDAATTATLVREIDGPLNLVIGLGEATSHARTLIDAGVQRVSVGGSIARAALAFIRDCARELAERGTVGFATDQLSHAAVNAIFAEAEGRA